MLSLATPPFVLLTQPYILRYHAVQEFNRGVFNYLIATDESGLEGIEKDSDDEASDNEEPARKYPV